MAIADKRVHALRARGARHQLDGKDCDALAGDVLDGFDGAERTKKSDEHLVATKQRKIGFAGSVVGAVTQNLGDDVSSAKDVRALRENLRALGEIFGVEITRFGARASLNDHFQARFCQAGNGRRNERYAPLPRETFSGNTDNHEASSDIEKLDLIRIRILAGPHCTPVRRSEPHIKSTKSHYSADALRRYEIDVFEHPSDKSRRSMMRAVQCLSDEAIALIGFLRGQFIQQNPGKEQLPTFFTIGRSRQLAIVHLVESSQSVRRTYRGPSGLDVTDRREPHEAAA